MTNRTLIRASILTLMLFAPLFASAAPVVTASVTNNVIDPGDSVTLTWSSTGAATCDVNANGTLLADNTTTSGSMTFTPSTNTNYNVNCTESPGPLRWSRTSGPTTNVVPGVCSTGSTNSCGTNVPQGASCGTVNQNCSIVERNDIDIGSAQCRVTSENFRCLYAPATSYDTEFVRIRNVVTTLSASPQSVAPGGSTTLTWSSVGAVSCTGDGFSTGGATSGSRTVVVSDTTPFSVSCTNVSGDTDESVWEYMETDLSDLYCGSGCNRWDVPNDPDINIPYSGIDTCAPADPRGEPCSYPSETVCKWNRWRDPVDPWPNRTGANAHLYTDIYICAGPLIEAETDVKSVVVDARQPALAAVCRATPNPVGTNATTTWSVAATGGTGSYTYSWTGTDSLAGSTASLAKSYATSGVKNATTTITSGTGATLQTLVQGCTALTVSSGAGIDLTASAITPTSATTGTPVVFSSTISNIGTVNTGAAFSVMFKRSANSAGTSPTNLTPATSTPQLAGGTSRAVYKTYTFPATDANQTVYIQACADSTFEIPETNESTVAGVSNCGPWTGVVVGAAEQPNLTAASVTYTPSSVNISTPTTLSAVITNNGATTTSIGFTNVFQIDNNADHTTVYATRTDTSPALTVSGTDTTSVTYTFPAVGTWYVRACADNDATLVGAIAESNEGDNCSGTWTTITLGTPALSCIASDGSVGLNEDVTFTAIPSNGATGPYSWRDTTGTAISGTGTTITRSWSVEGDNYGTQVKASNMSTWQTCTPNVDVVCSGASCPCNAEDLTLTAAPDRVERTGTVVLTYEIPGVETGVNTCTLTTSMPGQSGWPKTITINTCDVEQEGTYTTHPILTQTTFTLTCGAETVTETVDVVPDISET